MFTRQFSPPKMLSMFFCHLPFSGLIRLGETSKDSNDARLIGPWWLAIVIIQVTHLAVVTEELRKLLHANVGAGVLKNDTLLQHLVLEAAWLHILNCKVHIIIYHTCNRVYIYIHTYTCD